MRSTFGTAENTNPETGHPRPAMLEGVRILDLSCFFSGPLGGYLLAQMGATVIKIEEPGAGDPARRLGLAPELSERLMGAAYLAANGGKQSVTLNLKSEEGKAIFRRLVARSDVLIENFRPGVMKRLGLDYDSLADAHPGLIYCAISGFGQTGPLSASPAFDQIIQGMSGVMSITGHPDGEPQRIGYPIADSLAGVFAALAICGALNRRARDGRGEMLDVSMLDSVMASMGWAVSNYLVAGAVPLRMGNDNFTSSPSGTFAAADGSLNIAINTQEQYEKLARALDRPDLVTDPRFRDRETRKANRALMNAEVEKALRLRTVDTWVRILAEAGIPAGHVLTVPQAFDHPQVRHRQLTQEFPDVRTPMGALKVLRPGFTSSAGAMGVAMPPTELGSGTNTVLGELGFTQAQIREFRQGGVI